ncbi:MAG: hypothetical protein ABII02_02465 [Candidatus Magasanikbacteria bacterium]
MSPQNFVPPVPPPTPGAPIQQFPAPMQTIQRPMPPKTHSALVPVLLSVIVTAAAVGVGVYFWQKMVWEDSAKESTEVMEGMITEQKSQLEEREIMISSKDVVIAERDKTIEEMKVEMEKGPSELKGKTFQEYLDNRMKYSIVDLSNFVNAYSATVKLPGCSEETEETCDRSVHVFAATDWDQEEGDQTFYLYEQTVDGDVYYGPFEDTLKTFLKNIDGAMMMDGDVTKEEGSGMEETPTST